MKPERHFIAERPLAQHCPELLRPAPAACELMAALAQLGDRLVRSLGGGLARMSGGDAPTVRSQPSRDCTMAELASDIGPLAANSLLSSPTLSAPFFASIEAAAVFRLVDRAFGGRGDVPSPLPEAFPLSAELLIARLEAAVTAAVSEALLLDGDGTVDATRRDGSLAHLTPFPAGAEMVALPLEIQPGIGPAWTLTLAFPAASLAELLGVSERNAAKPRPRVEADPASEPFCDLPLAVTAVLVDMRMGFAALSALQPGQILPVAVARSVPLKVGDKTVAHGTIGEVDDRVAIQITHAF